MERRPGHKVNDGGNERRTNYGSGRLVRVKTSGEVPVDYPDPEPDLRNESGGGSRVDFIHRGLPPGREAITRLSKTQRSERVAQDLQQGYPW